MYICRYMSIRKSYHFCTPYAAGRYMAGLRFMLETGRGIGCSLASGGTLIPDASKQRPWIVERALQTACCLTEQDILRCWRRIAKPMRLRYTIFCPMGGSAIEYFSAGCWNRQHSRHDSGRIGKSTVSSTAFLSAGIQRKRRGRARPAGLAECGKSTLQGSGSRNAGGCHWADRTAFLGDPGGRKGHTADKGHHVAGYPKQNTV